MTNSPDVKMSRGGGAGSLAFLDLSGILLIRGRFLSGFLDSRNTIRRLRRGKVFAVPIFKKIRQSLFCPTESEYQKASSFVSFENRVETVLHRTWVVHSRVGVMSLLISRRFIARKFQMIIFRFPRFIGVSQ